MDGMNRKQYEEMLYQDEKEVEHSMREIEKASRRFDKTYRKIMLGL